MQIKAPVEQRSQQDEAGGRHLVGVSINLKLSETEERPCGETNVGSAEWSKPPFRTISEQKAEYNCTGKFSFLSLMCLQPWKAVSP